MPAMNFGTLPNFTTPTHSVTNVQIASTKVLDANPNRVYALLINDSDTTMYIKFGTAANASQGIRLNANGGSFEVSPAHGNLCHDAIYATAATNGKNLLATEA